MLDIEKLKKAELPEIIECIDELYEADKVIKTALEKFKDSLKESGETIQTPHYTVSVSKSNRLVPAVDIRIIMEKYSVQDYPDMYAIKLSSDAGDIIKEPEFLTETTVKSVIFSKKK